MSAVHGKTAGELARFLGVGFTSVAIDFAAYAGLLGIGLQAGPAKAAGFVAGTVFAYFANRIITFRAVGGSATAARFILAYAIGFAVNVVSNAAFLWGLGTEWPRIPIAFLGATTLSTASNFLTMKFFVFAARHVGRSSQ